METANQHALTDRLLRACLMEATARKPGNVHPEAAFKDLTYDDLLRAAQVAAPILARTRERGIGRTILEAVTATRRHVGCNANLGIVLLLAPLAAVGPETSLQKGIRPVLQALTREDARLTYEAIRIADPGGLGRVDEQDISQEPTGTLLEVMRMAADRDAVALQYASGYRLVLEVGVPVLARGAIPGHGWEATAARLFPKSRAADGNGTSSEGAASPYAGSSTPASPSRRPARDWEQAVIRLQLILMTGAPDTLIARRRGADEAEESARRAGAVLAAGWPGTRAGDEKLLELDRWLREQGNARNPGTTADLVAASLFAALRDGQFEGPTLQEIGESAQTGDALNRKR